MPGITLGIMKSGMNCDYQEVQRVSKAVYKIVSKARKIRVTSLAGTDLVAEFGKHLRWIICDGRIKSGEWSNLPDGEVFTAPRTVNGRAVIDGCLGDYLENFGTLENTPVVVEIAGGRALKKSVSCNNKKIEREFKKCLFSTDANSDRVGEFAIGTNVGLQVLTGNLLQDEKFPGVHIAFGSPYPDKTGADWDSEGHLDAVMKKVTVYAGKTMIMRDGEFLI
jgi:leucyl aminopeptidase (aminopeptidase T)